MQEETLRDFYGKIIGFVQTQPNGDKTYRDFYRRIVAKYIKATNKTTDFYGRIIGSGDLGAGLLYNNKK